MAYLDAESPTHAREAAVATAAAATATAVTGAAAAVTITVSAQDASRLLSQAGFGGTDGQIAAIQSQGIATWINSQFNIVSDQSHWDWMIEHGFNAVTYQSSTAGIDATLWRKLMSSPDILRQRMALVLSEIFVVSLQGLPVGWRNFAVAYYMDMLAANAFGNFRTLLEAVTLSPAMGVYLGTRGNQKENPTTGRQADENFGREVMQLFTIGLFQLELDGSIKRDARGNPIETYTLDSVTQIARVFTGWNFDGFVATTPDHMRRPMSFNAKLHSTSQKSFLGVIIPEATSGPAALKTTLDTLFNHPNVAPFISKQLIQRMVTSNPSPAYIGRVARVFNSGDGGVRGDMKSVIRAILQDAEARTVPNSQNTGAGKLREPILRLAQWARTFKVLSPSGAWSVGDTSNQASRLGQSPLRSPTVFNFFRPGFVPAGGVLGDPKLVAPELQITNESTVVGYANYIQQVIDGKLADLKPDYAAEIPMAADPAALVNRLNLLLAAGQISSANLSAIQNAVASIAATTDAGKLNRVKAAIMLVMCSPEYIVQK